jgi:hypothetical protein
MGIVSENAKFRKVYDRDGARSLHGASLRPEFVIF